ncbi:MAG: hypothetical protein KF862_17585 [Chitinophagaceae bacterium]|nr:hypothetical protein [Chitinophagaceae bacterium]
MASMTHPSVVYSILQKHLPASMLQGYVSGIIDETGSRLYAFTFVEIDPGTFQNDYFDWMYSSTGFDEEKTRIYIDDGKCYQHKDLTQCVQEGIYRAFSLKFYGYFYEGCWYIAKELMYFGELITREDILKYLAEGIDNNTILSSSYYEPMEAHFPQWNPNEKPMSRGVEFLEFVGMPGLVAYVKQEEKQALLRAHSQYLYLETFKPMMDRLRAKYFEEYAEFITLYSIEPTLIFSTCRNFVLTPIMVKNAKEEYRISWFFRNDDEKKMYKWNYFEPDTYLSSIHYSQEIIHDLSALCYWNDYTYLNSSCTLDDDNFWKSYVLVKENGLYKHLEELKY